ncbi:DUF732 domain-containing protein [Aldersonia kunmingensis]|uniref:DUF732 domain-containing protein n=1 Tax=Aldersonia kunmingensis TaxID=408066 RepID=UPI0008360A52|nr:DUF732 domain-containing protein [Aldersonia kunmingensis]
MPRNTLRAVSLAALAVAAAGVLTACGDDSTATSTPTSLSPSSTTAAAESSAAPEATGTDAIGTDAPPADATGTDAIPVSPGEAATAPPETPQAMPSDFPGPEAAPMGDAEKKYLAELKSEGIEYSGNGESAVVIANYVCAAQEAGEPDESIAVNVGAMAGVEQSLTGGDMDPAEAGQIYIDVAKSTYCL